MGTIDNRQGPATVKNAANNNVMQYVQLKNGGQANGIMRDTARRSVINGKSP